MNAPITQPEMYRHFRHIRNAIPRANFTENYGKELNASLDTLHNELQRVNQRLQEADAQADLYRKQSQEWQDLVINWHENDGKLKASGQEQSEWQAQFKANAADKAQELKGVFKGLFKHFREYVNVAGAVDYDAEFAEGAARYAVEQLVESEEMYLNGQPDPVYYWKEVLKYIRKVGL